MQSNKATVDDYLAEVPADRLDALVGLRNLFRKVLPEFEEAMRYGGPTYSRNGDIEVGFGSQKHFIGIYLMRTDVLDAYRSLFEKPGVSIGKSVIRFASPDKIDHTLVEKLLRAIRAAKGAIPRC